MELKRSMLKERISLFITLINCICVSVFIMIELESEMFFMIVVLVVIAILRLKKHIRCLMQSPKLISVDNHGIQLKYNKTIKEISLNDIKRVELHIHSKRSAVFVIEYKDKIIYLEKRLYKNFIELCDEFEGYSLNRFDYMLYNFRGRSIKHKNPYMKKMLWQDFFIKKYRFNDTKGYTTVWLIFLVLWLLNVITAGDFSKGSLVSSIKILAFFVISFSGVTFYNIRGYSYWESIKKYFTQLVKIPVTMFCVLMCLNYVINIL